MPGARVRIAGRVPAGVGYMKMIGLASDLWMDESGAFILKSLPETRTRSGERRLSRRKTLDGGVVITDGGFSEGDRSMSVQVTSTEDLWAALWYFFQNVNQVVISADGACYLGMLERVSEADGIVSLNMMIKEKISEV